MVKLARDLNVPVKPCFGGSGIKVFSNGKHVNNRQEIVADDAWKKMQKIIADAAAGHHAPDCSCANAILQRTQQHNSGTDDDLHESVTMLLGQHVKDIELHRSLLHNRIYFALENYEGARFDRMSAKHGGDGSQLHGPNADVYDGYGTLLEELGKNNQTLLGRAVTEVLYSDEGIPTVQVSVRCVVQNGDAEVHEQYSAPCCIVALPLGVLQDNAVNFSPPLPQEKKASIARLGVALMNKVELVWTKRWWPEDTTSIVICALDSTPTYHPWPWFFEPPSARKHPLGWATLVCFLTGQFAEDIEGMSDADIAHSAVAALVQACGCDVPEPKAVNATKWGTDPFSRGSWTYFATNSSCADVTELAKPCGALGCVAFAGEHTCDGSERGLDIGTVHGAWLSGEVAAKGLLGRMHTKKGLFFPLPGRRCSYRHVTDQPIPRMGGYEEGSPVVVTSSPTEIGEELRIDPDEAPHIAAAQACCSKKGTITARSVWGWLEVTFDDGCPPRWFTPFCLWLLDH